MIFNCNRNPDHPLHETLAEIISSPNHDQQAIACNLMHEPRVSEKRQNGFLDFTGECKTADEFHQCWKKHHDERIRQSAEFDNGTNIENLAPDRSEPLVNIFVINGLSEIFAKVKDALSSSPEHYLSRLPEDVRASVDEYFRTYPAGARADSKATKQFLDEIMADEFKRRDFFKVISLLHDIHHQEYPHHPIWLTTKEQFQRCRENESKGRANRWCHFVGLSTDTREGEWVIILPFDRAKLGEIYHPSVLDSGSPYYFPVPHGDGIAVDLRMEEGLGYICEYICKRPSLKDAEIDEIDFVEECDILQHVAEEPLPEIRKHHISKLREVFGANDYDSAIADAWLDRIGSLAV